MGWFKNAINNVGNVLAAPLNFAQNITQSLVGATGALIGGAGNLLTGAGAGVANLGAVAGAYVPSIVQGMQSNLGGMIGAGVSQLVEKSPAPTEREIVKEYVADKSKSILDEAKGLSWMAWIQRNAVVFGVLVVMFIGLIIFAVVGRSTKTTKTKYRSVSRSVKDRRLAGLAKARKAKALKRKGGKA